MTLLLSAVTLYSLPAVAIPLIDNIFEPLLNPLAHHIIDVNFWYEDDLTIVGFSLGAIHLGYAFLIVAGFIVLAVVLWALVTLGLELTLCIISAVCCRTSSGDGTAPADNEHELLNPVNEDTPGMQAAQLAEALDSGNLPPDFNKLTTWDLTKIVAPLAIDVCGDLLSIKSMLFTQNYKFAMVLITTFFISAGSALLDGHVQSLREETQRSLRRGFLTDRLVHMQRKERGFEAFLSSCITIYAIPFAFTTASSFFSAILSIGSACWNMGTHVYEVVDLGVETAPDQHQSSE